MGGLILRRLVFSVVALLLVSLVLFVLTRAIPGSPARMVLGFDATPAQVVQFNHEHGLDRPVIVQYLTWLNRLVLHGDLGKSLVTGLSMNSRVIDTAPVTMELVALAFLFAVVLSVVLGAISAFYEGTMADHLARIFAVPGVSVPGFWLALLLILSSRGQSLLVSRRWRGAAFGWPRRAPQFVGATGILTRYFLHGDP